MPLHLILNETEQRGAWCRVCRSRVQGTEETVARHIAHCAQEHFEAKHPERQKLAFLKPWDPEYQDWLTTAYRQGRVRPSTDRV